jgi:hypothetical protein
MSDLFEHFERLLTTSELDQIKAMDTPFKIQHSLTAAVPCWGKQTAAHSGDEERSTLSGWGIVRVLLCADRIPPLIVDLQPEPGSDVDHVWRSFRNSAAGSVASDSAIAFTRPI